MNIVAKLVLVYMVNVMEGPTKSFANVTLVGWEKIVKQKVILSIKEMMLRMVNSESLDNMSVYILVLFEK